MTGGYVPEHWSFPRIFTQIIRKTPQSREREKLLRKEVTVSAVHARVHTVLPLFSRKHIVCPAVLYARANLPALVL